MTNEHMTAITATVSLIASFAWWIFAYREFREARAHEKLFFERLAANLYECGVDREAKRAAENAAVVRTGAQIAADDAKLRAALDLIPATDTRSVCKSRREFEAREIISKTPLDKLEAALSERPVKNDLAPLFEKMNAPTSLSRMADAARAAKNGNTK
ncbi:hypothetical protein [Sphingomonas sp. GB1N7]|uniref:hypothetical protein n=1 Tax=Parasphingomonas caseinilytica TaxID=3096158 RepID=UPI002FCB47FE